MRNILFFSILLFASIAYAQQPIAVGAGSYASFPPLSESRSANNNNQGSQAYQMEHRDIYAVDSLLTRPLPSNDWWTYALVNPWTGKLWAYPALVWADATGISVAKPSYWEPTGCEMKWNDGLLVTTTALYPSRPFSPQAARISHWSDYMIAFVLEDDNAQVRVTLMQGSPLVWMEFTNATPKIANSDPSALTIFQHSEGDKTIVAVAVLTEGLTREDLEPYAFRVPRHTQINYDYLPEQSTLRTQYDISYQDIVPTSANGMWQGFLPHHYYETKTDVAFVSATYETPRGKMRMAQGNHFVIDYPVHGMLPFFPLPYDSLPGYDAALMRQLCLEYAEAGSFGADTYWGGKGLTQMAHYMTTAYQMGDTATYSLAKSRLKATLVDWYTYTVGEDQYYFARYDRWGALVGFDSSYDSDTFNDHHFHYGYFVYASALLCMLDDDFRRDYGAIAREVALDYANYDRNSQRYPYFRTFNPYLGHSFAGGMGNEGNGNGQESSSESMQGWGGVWMLGAALGDNDLLEAGIYGYTLEARGTAEYWFDRGRRNIDYTKYQHPYCCNLTMQGVGWWTWFSGDPVWMHSIQWLPISPILQNYLSQNRDFARWDYTQMYAAKEVGNYEAMSGGLGDESGLGNVCLSYLALFDPDSAANVWNRMRSMGKALAKNPDTGGITYLLAHSLRAYGHQDHTISANYPLAVAFTDSLTAKTTYAVYNPTDKEITVQFYQSGNTVQWVAPANRLSLFKDKPILTTIHLEGPSVVLPTTTNRYTLRFYDQYGALYRTDSTILYTAPSMKQQTQITATYQSLTTTLAIRIGELPYMANAKIVPAIDYLSLGQELDFSVQATDQYGNTYPIDWTYHFAPATPGQYVITYDGEQVLRDTVTVLPPYPNIALDKTVEASSYENVGTLPQGLNDGDYTTRWGSAHKDNEYIRIDLEQASYIDHLVLHWEAAYASRFAIIVSETIPDMPSIIAKQQYTTYQSSGGVQTISVAQNGRYITLVGLARATAYGISLYELEAYGMPLTGDNNQLFGLAIYADRDALTMNEELVFEVKGYNRKGEQVACTPHLEAEGGVIKGGNRLVPSATGTMHLTASIGEVSITRSFVVLECEQIVSTTVSPKRVTLPEGDVQLFTVSAVNQFGMTEMQTTEIFEATTIGEHHLIVSLGGFTDTAYIQVKAYADVNLALGKPTYVSGYENAGTIPENATDGLLDTRWSSRHQDNEWIMVDLERVYWIDRVKLYWEAAYATKYEIQVSEDGLDFTTAYATDNAKGGVQDIPLSSGLIQARYVRIPCYKRNTNYGSSLYEIEIYGSRNATDESKVIVPQDNHVRYILRNGNIYIVRGADIYTILGQKLQDIK